jgi:phospholipid/cholesterol/gamma-HCH transport system ATP-binding protein
MELPRQQRFADSGNLCKNQMMVKENGQKPVIEFRDVTLQFADLIVLKNINVEIFPGEKFVVVGPSGQGKSVFLKLIAGLLTPTKGAVCIEGQDLLAMPRETKQSLMLRMGMLFQKNALFDSMTAGGNVRFPLEETTDLGPEQIEKKSRDYLDAVGLAHAYDLFPDEISGGMQKRLGIARSLALDPEIVLYDDPTAGLDPITSRKIIDLIVELQRKKNSTVVAVTNDMNRGFQMADRMAMVVDQEVIVTGTVAATKGHPDPRVQQFIHGKLEGPLLGAT